MIMSFLERLVPKWFSRTVGNVGFHWHNFALMFKVRWKYGIKRHYAFSNNSGYCRVNYDGSKIEIKYGLWPTSRSTLTFAHELGHIFHKDGLCNHEITKELAAWQFALIWLKREGVVLNAWDYGDILASFCTYICRLDNESQRYYTAVLNKMWHKHFLCGETKLEEIAIEKFLSKD